jgi:predicted Mrr-cat superfamily restriction endonuclease
MEGFNMVNYWMIRAFPGNVDHIDYFLANNVVGLGWVNINNLANVNLDNLKQIFVKNNYPASSPQAMGRRIGFFRRFIDEIKINDYVLVPDQNGMVHIGRITSNYYYQKLTNELGHLRNVEWIRSIDFHEFPNNVQLLLSNRLSLISLHKTSQELSAIIENNNIITINRSIEKNFIAHINGNKVSLTMPENLTKSELNVFFAKVIQQF